MTDRKPKDQLRINNESYFNLNLQSPLKKKKFERDAMIETSDKGPRSLHGDDSSNRKTDSQKDTRRHN